MDTPGNLSSWEKEFPILFYVKKPKLFLWKLLQSVDWFISKILFFGLWLLIGYFVYVRLTNTVSNNYIDPLSQNFIQQTISSWKGYRAVFLSIWFYWSLALLVEGIIEIIRRRFSNLAKLIWRCFLMLVFINLSYAISGLISDVIFLVMFLQKQALQKI